LIDLREGRLRARQLGPCLHQLAKRSCSRTPDSAIGFFHKQLIPLDRGVVEINLQIASATARRVMNRCPLELQIGCSPAMTLY
jgi:hypothetical protein